MKDKVKLLLRPVVFGVVLLVVLGTLNTLFTPVWTDYNNYFTMNGFYKEPKNTVETVFLGASVPSSFISSTELYKEYGLCAYSLANPEQPVMASYYLLEDTYKRHSDTLKNVFFDVSELRGDTRDETVHKALDYMPLSLTKIKAVYEYCEGDFTRMFNYLFPLSEFHNRWADLEWKDFDYFGKDPINGTRGYTFFLDSYRYKEASMDATLVRYSLLYEEAIPVELVDEAVVYFERMVQFCEENDLNLILFKCPANNWNSKFHNAVADLAEEYDLEYIDFNFEPYMSETGYNHAFDSRDGYHANYYGATKITRWLGEYLVNECNATDVRGDKRYAFMEKEADRFDKMYYREYEMNQADDITECITVAMKDNNTIFLTVKEDAATALTEEQRKYFHELGLEKLAVLKTGDAYIGVIDNGKVLYEKLLPKKSEKASDDTEAAKEDTDTYLSHFVRLDDGTRVSLVSGLREDKFVSSCTINGRERSSDKLGMNIVVYNNEYKEFMAAINFNTAESAIRQHYETDFYKLFDDEAAIKENSDNKFFMQALIYNEMFTAKNSGVPAEKINADNDVFAYLEKYIHDKNNIIIITVKDEASTALTSANRKLFAKYGLKELSAIEARDSYIAVIDGGKVVFEKRQNGTKTPLTYTSGKIVASSAGFTAGSKSSIKINGKEYSENVRGLNIVVYNKKYNQVFDVNYFDTYSKAITTAVK